VGDGDFDLPQQCHDLLRLVADHGHDQSSLQVNSLSLHLVQKSPVSSITLNKKGRTDDEQSRIRYCYCQSRMTEERKFEVIWLADGSYRDVSATEKKPESEQQKAAVRTALDENPDASLRELEQMTGVSKSAIQRWHLKPAAPHRPDPKPEG
ncbi:MAG TPA: hypothetical protein VEJ46_00855, partial [Candidatus Acidoferrum sp.]|nr:hypothetical protein [Candidatus Acidoferrum sp.]